MKTILLAIIATLATQAHGLPEDSLPTLAEVQCKSVFEGIETVRVGSKRTSNSEGYTTSMTLSYDQQEYAVHTVLVEPSDVALVLAHSSLGNVLEIEVEQNPELLDRDGYGPATVKIDGVAEDYLKFVCKVGFVN